MNLESEKYFCGITPEDDDIDFWSNHFDNYVFRLVCTWEISKEYGDKFLAWRKWFQTEILSSSDGFKREVFREALMH